MPIFHPFTTVYVVRLARLIRHQFQVRFVTLSVQDALLFASIGA